MSRDYAKEIKAWNWEEIVAKAQEYGRCFLGTVMALYPSGKYYVAWACNNVTAGEVEKDGAYRDAMEAEAEKHGGWIENGDGDPCDLFFALPYPEECS